MTFYRERLWPSAWIFLALTLVIPASLLVFLPINVFVGVVTATVLYLGCVAFLVVSAPAIEVTDTQIVAGRARLPLEFVGSVSAHEGTDATLERGQRLDARAWLMIRGWVSPVVKLVVEDPQDPAPYWIVSTRHPKDLTAAIAEARSREV